MEQMLQPIGQEPMGGPDEGGEDAIDRIFDLTIGEYDLVVKSGPSYTTLREQTREELIEIIRSVPESAQVLGPMYLRQCDWPGADEAADKIEQGGVPPEVQAEMDELRAKADDSQLKAAELELEYAKIELEREKLAVEREKIQAGVLSALARPPATNPHQGVA
jgi:hypothetical protein